MLAPAPKWSDLNRILNSLMIMDKIKQKIIEEIEKQI
jgi:hypothetical protein